jgi:hypothetical protein
LRGQRGGARIAAIILSHNLDLLTEHATLGILLLGQQFDVYNVATAIPNWRGVLLVKGLSNGPHTLPPVTQVVSTSTLVYTNVQAAPATIVPQPGQLINNGPSLVIPANTTRVIRPLTAIEWAAD